MKITKNNFYSKTNLYLTLTVLSSAALSLVGCNSTGSAGVGGLIPNANGATNTSPASSKEGPIPPAPRSYKVDALIYKGDATATGDAESIIDILDSHHRSYEIVNSAQMNKMKMEDYNQYGMIVWPGGYAGQMSGSLTQEARESIRRAVNETGVSFVGFCAGAFIAVSPAKATGTAGSWGLSLLNAPTLDYYYLENEGIEDSMVQVKLPGGATRNLIWWGGPFIPDYPGGVVARYAKTGQAAIAQTWTGNGLMIISGPHPEAPVSWQARLGLNDTDGPDHDLTWSLFDAALNRKPLPTLN